MIRTVVAVSALAAILAAPAVAQPRRRAMPAPMEDPRAPMSAFAQPSQGETFVRLAGAGDLFEIQSSQAALQNTRNPELRRYAQMLIDHHTRLSEATMRAARQAGVAAPPPALEPHQQAMLADLQQARGGEFDSLYVRYQIAAHQGAFGLMNNYAMNGDRAPLRRAAMTAKPVVQDHLMQAERMAMRMAG